MTNDTVLILTQALQESARSCEWIAARLSDPSGNDVPTSSEQLKAIASSMRAAISKATGQ